MEKNHPRPVRKKKIGKKVDPASKLKLGKKKLSKSWPSPSRPLSKLEKGRLGEEVAASYFKGQGFLLLARNYHSRRGEVDLICAKGQVLVFVEVKARSSFRWGQPQDWVTPSKQARLVYTARAFLRDPSVQAQLGKLFPYQGPAYFRFDILEVDLSKKKVRHLENAFQPGASL